MDPEPEPFKKAIDYFNRVNKSLQAYKECIKPRFYFQENEEIFNALGVYFSNNQEDNDTLNMFKDFIEKSELQSRIINIIDNCKKKMEALLETCRNLYSNEEKTEPLTEKELKELEKELYLDENSMVKIHELMIGHKFVVFRGPPGTGKSYIARRYAKKFVKREENVDFIQFHPKYAYQGMKILNICGMNLY